MAILDGRANKGCGVIEPIRLILSEPPYIDQILKITTRIFWL